MGNVKLLQVLREFQEQGDAYQRAMFRHTGDVVYEEHLAFTAARERGYTDGDFERNGIDAAAAPC